MELVRTIIPLIILALQVVILVKLFAQKGEQDIVRARSQKHIQTVKVPLFAQLDKYYFSMPRELLNTKNHKTPTHTITNTQFKDVELVKLMTDALTNTKTYNVRVDGWSTEYKWHWNSTIKDISNWDNLTFEFDPKADTFNFKHRRNN